jgi:hypothetical protein
MSSTREPSLKGGLSTIDLLVLLSLDQLLFPIEYCIFVANQATSMRRSTVLSFPFQLAFPVSTLANTYILVPTVEGKEGSILYKVPP